MRDSSIVLLFSNSLYDDQFWYPYSPFAQKIGWILNYKKVEYKTVLIDVMEPRPKRRPFDGGYRKTPVLQVGQHTFCDTKTIIAEIEKL